MAVPSIGRRPSTPFGAYNADCKTVRTWPIQFLIGASPTTSWTTPGRWRTGTSAPERPFIPR